MRKMFSTLALVALLAMSQPAAACSTFDLFCWGKEGTDFIWDELKGIGSLTLDAILLRPKDVWNDFKDIEFNEVCGRLTVVSLLGANGVEDYFDDCASPPHSIEPDILTKLSLYFKSNLSSVRIHEGCNKLPSSRKAITFGEHIYFNSGKYAPRSPDGFATLAHELTHVLQYRKKGFGDFICEYAESCSFDRYGRNASNLCTIEKEAYHFEDLVL